MFKPTNIKDHERLFNREIKRRKDSIKQLVRFILTQNASGGRRGGEEIVPKMVQPGREYG
jgi:hypothetical protein